MFLSLNLFVDCWFDVDWLFHGGLIIFDRGFHYQQYGDVVDKLDLVWI